VKKLLLLILITACLIAKGQNYQCLQAGVKHYFTNGNGYLRGIRIDSVTTMGDTTVYYPFHTPRGAYNPSAPLSDTMFDNNGGSWLGKRVLQKNDGTFIFDSYWNDSVIIKTQANPGDSWMFYRDTSTLYYEATMLGIDTITVLGTLDSIKTIMITARNPFGIVTSDPLDSFKIMISKNNGFVQVFDLYTFPYHKPGSTYHPGLDYFVDKSTLNYLNIYYPEGVSPASFITIFSLVDFINPNDQQLHNWDTGDVIESCYGCNFTIVPFGPLNHTYILDTIVSKSVSGLITSYSFSGSYYHCVYPYPCSLINNASVYSFSSAIYPIADSNYFPEEHLPGYFVFYFPFDSAYCKVSPAYIHVPYILTGDAFGYEFSCYKLGIGRTLYNYADLDNGIGEADLLTYYKINGISCGTYTNDKVINQNLLPYKIQIFPNPATEELTIKTTLTQPYTITLQNMLGETVQTLRTAGQKQTINVSSLPAGVYNVSITEDGGSRYNEKVVVIPRR